MSSTEPRTGYELAAKILATHPDDAIETMLRCSHGTESDWLEFKAGMTLLPEDEAKGFKPDDLYWNYAEAIAAMANTFGGALVIGVNNRHVPVPLSQCDPRGVLKQGDVDDYIRKEILDRIAPEAPKQQSWTDRKGTTWAIENARLSAVVEARQVKFKGETVVVLLVAPKPVHHEFFVVRKDLGPTSELLPHRKIGDVGEVVRLSSISEIQEFQNGRNPGNDRYASLFRQAAPALFICHSSKDERAANQFRKHLEANGVTCWFAPNNLSGGDLWLDTIHDAINSSTSLLVLVSRHSLQSSWVKSEVAQAFTAKKRIIPVKIDDSPLDQSGLQLVLSSFQMIDATKSEKEAANQVVATLSRSARIEISDPSFPGGAPDPASGDPNTTVFGPRPESSTRYDKLVSAFRESLQPNSAGILPILQVLKRSPMPNIDFPTLGGRLWWDTLATERGWRIQRNKLFKQFRILDEQNFRRAWGWRRGMERMLENAHEFHPDRSPPPSTPPPIRFGPGTRSRFCIWARFVPLYAHNRVEIP